MIQKTLKGSRKLLKVPELSENEKFWKEKLTSKPSKSSQSAEISEPN
jgi:hypothetical protein